MTDSLGDARSRVEMTKRFVRVYLALGVAAIVVTLIVVFAPFTATADVDVTFEGSTPVLQEARTISCPALIVSLTNLDAVPRPCLAGRSTRQGVAWGTAFVAALFLGLSRQSSRDLQRRVNSYCWAIDESRGNGEQVIRCKTCLMPCKRILNSDNPYARRWMHAHDSTETCGDRFPIDVTVSSL